MNIIPLDVWSQLRTGVTIFVHSAYHKVETIYFSLLG